MSGRRPLPGEVRVYEVPVTCPAAVIDRLRRTLTPAERADVDDKVRPDDRMRAVVARAAVRHLLAPLLGMPPAEIPIRTGPAGKPQLAAEAGSDLRFNVSHSGELVLVALSAGREVGVDVEQVGPGDGIERVADRFFSETERQLLVRLPAPERNGASYACWTLKEAYLKARGGGLDRPLESFDVLRPATTGAPAPVERVHGWPLVTVTVDDGYAAALCAEPGEPGLPVEVHPLPLAEATLGAAG